MEAPVRKTFDRSSRLALHFVTTHRSAALSSSPGTKGKSFVWLTRLGCSIDEDAILRNKNFPTTIPPPFSCFIFRKNRLFNLSNITRGFGKLCEFSFFSILCTHSYWILLELNFHFFYLVVINFSTESINVTKSWIFQFD